MARDFRAKQVRTSIIIASGSLTGSKPHLGLAFVSGSKMLNHDGEFLTGSGNPPSLNTTPLFNVAGEAQAEPGLFLSHDSIGTDVWCLFDGASGGEANIGNNRIKGSSVLFLGDVVVSGSLFAERHVVEVDKTAAGNFYVPKNAYIGEGWAGAYGLRVNPTNGAVGGLAARTVAVGYDGQSAGNGTQFHSYHNSHFGGGFGSSGLTIDHAGNLTTDGKLQIANLAFTDGDNAITIEDGGFVRLDQGFTGTTSTLVSRVGVTSGVGQWIRFAHIEELADHANDSAHALFLLKWCGLSSGTSHDGELTILVEATMSANVDGGTPAQRSLRVEVFDNDWVDDGMGYVFDPTNGIEMRCDNSSTNPRGELWIRSPASFRTLHASILVGNRKNNNSASTYDGMEWVLYTDQTYIDNGVSRAIAGEDQVINGTLTHKNFQKVRTAQLTGSAGIAVEMNSQKLTLFHNGSENVLSSSANLKLIANGGAGDVLIDGNFGMSQVAVEQYVRHTGDADTYFEFPANDQVQIRAGGIDFLHIVEDDSQDKLTINPDNNDVDFIVLGTDSNKKWINVEAGSNKVELGADASGNPSMRVEDATVTINPANQTTTFQINDNAGAALFSAVPANKSVTILGDADNDSIFKVKAAADTLLDVTDHATDGISLGHASVPVKTVGNLEVGGNLEVKGTFTKVNTTDLYVKDPVIVLGEGTQTLNSNGGIVICSGSNQAAKPDLVWGRVANDTWGAGVKNTVSGSVTTLADMTLANIRASRFELGAAEEYISGDGDDINFTVGAGGDINIPANIGLTFGNDGEKIEGDGTDLRVFANNLILSASADVLIPGGVGLAWGPNSTEKIEGNGSKLTISTAGDIDLDPGGAIRVTGDNQIEFGNADSGEYIKRRLHNSGGILIRTDGQALELNANNGSAPVLIGGNGATKIRFGDRGTGATNNNQWIGAPGASQDADLTLNAGVDIVLNATQQVRIPENVELEFGDAGSGEHIYGDGTDLHIVSGNDIILSSSNDVLVDGSSKLEFFIAGSGEHIVGDGTNLTLASGGDINLTATADINIPQDIGLTFGADTQKIESDGSNNLSIAAAGEVKSLTDLNIATSKQLRFTDNNVRIYRDGLNMMFRDQRQTTPVDLTTLNTRDVSTTTIRHALGPDRIKASGSFSIDKQDRFANDLGSDIWFYVDSNDGTRNKSVFAKDLILSSSLKFVDTADALSTCTITHTNDDLIFVVDSTEMARLDKNIGLKLGNGKGIYFNSITHNLTKATDDFKFSTGNGAAAGLLIGDDNDGYDRKVTFGHSTLKTVLGVDDSADAFIINTDATFDNTLKNNSLTIDANHNVGIGGDLTVHGGDIFDTGAIAALHLSGSGNIGVYGSLSVHGNIIKNRQNEATINLDDNQRVGIGGIAPSYMLDVDGDIRVRGNDIRDNSGNPAITFDGSANTTTNGTLTLKGHALPHANNTYDLGSNTHRFRNIYTNDLNLCNEGRGNDIDGTSGNWTIQEGEDHLYVINNITGKKFKMMLQPVEDGE